MSDLEKKPLLSKRIKIIILASIIVVGFWFMVHPFKCHLQSVWAVDDIENNLDRYETESGDKFSFTDIKDVQNFIFWACFDNFPDRIDEVRMRLVIDDVEELQT